MVSSASLVSEPPIMSRSFWVSGASSSSSGADFTASFRDLTAFWTQERGLAGMPTMDASRRSTSSMIIPSQPQVSLGSRGCHALMSAPMETPSLTPSCSIASYVWTARGFVSLRTISRSMSVYGRPSSPRRTRDLLIVVEPNTSSGTL